jgi:hypothetical protein
VPGREVAFDLIEMERGSLIISVYGLLRWVDQTPGELALV